ncbi:MAG: glycosyltransferase family 1 protein [Prochloraceae cyanobacterium]|nr:glycosyltransferase family 1 protein [Prochloraceae cyanobacterium]
MKIVYDYQIFNSQKYGGVSRYIYEIATRIARFNGFKVNILAGLYVNKYLKNSSQDLVFGWPRPLLPKTTKIIARLNAQVSKILLRRDPPDIIHETYYLPRGIAPKSCKTIITVHDMIHEKFSNLFKEKQRRFSLIKAEAIRRADRVICVSNQTKKDLIEILDINPQKISVIYHGSSLQISDSLDRDTSSIEYPYILYVGKRQGYKNFDRLLQGYAKCDSLNNNFKLVCTGQTRFSSSELNRIYDLGLNEDKVKYVSGDDRTLAKLYKQASVFVYPSLYEGFGIPLLEAMSLGCPIVCSNTSSIPEVVDNAAEFFDPYEVDSIVNALEKVLFSSERVKSLVTLGGERIKHFSWEASAKQTSLVYSSLLL